MHLYIALWTILSLKPVSSVAQLALQDGVWSSIVPGAPEGGVGIAPLDPCWMRGALRASAKLQSSSNVSWLLIWLGFRHSCFQDILIPEVRFLPSVLRFYPSEFLNAFQKCQPRPRQTYLLGRSARSPERVVEPCRKPGVDFVCPALCCELCC